MIRDIAIVFVILLVLLIIISAIGGSVRYVSSYPKRFALGSWGRGHHPQQHYPLRYPHMMGLGMGAPNAHNVRAYDDDAYADTFLSGTRRGGGEEKEEKGKKNKKISKARRSQKEEAGGFDEDDEEDEDDSDKPTAPVIGVDASPGYGASSVPASVDGKDHYRTVMRREGSPLLGDNDGDDEGGGAQTREEMMSGYNCGNNYNCGNTRVDEYGIEDTASPLPSSPSSADRRHMAPPPIPVEEETQGYGDFARV